MFLKSAFFGVIRGHGRCRFILHALQFDASLFRKVSNAILQALCKLGVMGVGLGSRSIEKKNKCFRLTAFYSLHQWLILFGSRSLEQTVLLGADPRPLVHTFVHCLDVAEHFLHHGCPVAKQKRSL